MARNAVTAEAQKSGKNGFGQRAGLLLPTAFIALYAFYCESSFRCASWVVPAAQIKDC